MSQIHPTAVVSPHARLGCDVTIGPFCVVEDDVLIESGCRLASHVVIKNGTEMGQKNLIDEGTVLGGRPQHLKACQRIGRLRIGDGNSFRENVTVHCGLHEGDHTDIGNNTLIMVNAHIGHDCRIADHVVIANNTMLGGHTTVNHHAYLSGAVGVHQFCRIGQYAIVGGQAHIKQDVPPFVTVDGYSTQIVGLNLIGLRRNGFSNEEIRQLKAAYRVIYRSQFSWEEVLGELKSRFAEGPASEFHPFLSTGQRGFIQARQESRAAITKLPHAVPAGELPSGTRKAA